MERIPGSQIAVRAGVEPGYVTRLIELGLIDPDENGTTHPMLTMGALTEGEFDGGAGRFYVEGGQRCYVATDHLEAPGYQALTPDDILDRVGDPRLSWNEEQMVGVALHLVSAIAVAGRLGMTAIGASPKRGG